MKIFYVQVRFRSSERKYCYKSFLVLKKGDTVLVNSANGIGLAEVMEPDVQDKIVQKFAIAYVLDYIDMDALKAKLLRFKKMERHPS